MRKPARSRPPAWLWFAALAAEFVAAMLPLATVAAVCVGVLVIALQVVRGFAAAVAGIVSAIPQAIAEYMVALVVNVVVLVVEAAAKGAAAVLLLVIESRDLLVQIFQSFF